MGEEMTEECMSIEPRCNNLLLIITCILLGLLLLVTAVGNIVTFMSVRSQTIAIISTKFFEFLLK